MTSPLLALAAVLAAAFAAGSPLAARAGAAPDVIPLEECGEYPQGGLEAEGEGRFSTEVAGPGMVRLRVREADGDCDGPGRISIRLLGTATPAGFEAIEGPGGECPNLVAEVGADTYGIVVSNVEGEAIDPYVVHFSSDECATCGDGKIEGGESCDDGVEAAASGCGADCRLVIAECGTYERDALLASELEDFVFELSEPATVYLGVAEAAGGCASPVSMHVQVFDDAGVEIGGALEGDAGECPALSRSLEAGTYRVRVSDAFSGLFGGIPAYGLSYSSDECAVCGDGVVEASEQCDDEGDERCEDCRVVLGDCRSFERPGIPPGVYEEFRLELDSSDEVRIETTGIGGGCPGRADLEIFDAEGNLLVPASEDIRQGPCSKLYVPLDAGSYAVRVYPDFSDGLRSYTLRYSSNSCAECGNGSEEGPEECDDGNTVAGDGCTADCERRLLECGDFDRPALAAGEPDDLRFTLEESTTVMLGVRAPDGQCLDDEVIAVLDAGGELVDYSRNPACAELETRLPAGEYTARVFAEDALDEFVLSYSTMLCAECGNGRLEFDEMCDDGNLENGDGCNDACRPTLDQCGFVDIPSSGGDPFEMLFVLGKTETIRLETSKPGGDCPPYESILVYAANGQIVASDFVGGPGFCSRVVATLPAGTYRAHVDRFEGQALAWSTSSCAVCGDGAGQAGEECDDGNGDPGDGCRPDCTKEHPVLPECSAGEHGAIAGGDEATFGFVLAKEQRIRLEVSTAGGPCAIATRLAVFDADGELVAADARGGEGLCSRLLTTLPAGPYTVTVSDRSGFALDPYVLEYYVEDCSQCGNGIVEVEQCDDGGLEPGDGCDQNCRITPRPIEICGSTASAGLVYDDRDEFTFALEEESDVEVRLTGANGICPAGALLSFSGPFHPGNLTTDCHVIRRGVPAGEHTVRVLSELNHSTGPYSVSVRTGDCATCGNGEVEFGEQCDGGPEAPGDGCDANCRRILDHCGDYPMPGLAEDDFFETTFVLDEPGTIRFDVVRSTGACDRITDLDVFDDSGVLVASEHGTFLGDCVQLVADLPAGSYTLEATRNGSSSSTPLLRVFDASCSECGNGTLEAEYCDDGNTVDGDGCESDCRPPVIACGESVGIEAGASRQFRFALDSTQTVRVEQRVETGNCGIGSELTIRDAGNSIVAQDTVAGSCSTIVVELPAGEYRIETSSDFPFPSDDAAYSLHFSASACATCGNGNVEAAEQCDDGNTVPGDGCTSQCERVMDVCESYTFEGVPDIDVDRFALTLDETTSLRIHVTDESGGCLHGPFVSFYRNGDWIDSVGDGNCSYLAADLPAGQYELRFVAGYFLHETSDSWSVRLTTDACATCGDGEVEGGESCDDGNSSDTDGCTTGCTLELRGCGQYVRNGQQEIDEDAFALHLDAEETVRLDTFGIDGPCDSPIQIRVWNASEDLVASDFNMSGAGYCASLVATLPAGDYRVSIEGSVREYVLGFSSTACATCGNGVLEAAEICDDDGDGCGEGCTLGIQECGRYERPGLGRYGIEVFPFTLDQPESVKIEIGARKQPCGGLFEVSVFDEEGQFVAGDEGDYVCPRFEAELPAGSYTLEVRLVSHAADNEYELHYSTTSCAECGNGEIDIGEECDDGNLAAGDGCDGSCRQRIESCGVYDARGLGDLSYAFSLDAPEKVQLELGGPDGACPAETWGRLFVRNEDTGEWTGAPFTGYGECSILRVMLPAGRYQLEYEPVGTRHLGDHVVRFSTASCSTCGNGEIEIGETCEDGNTAAGDGCDPSCVLDPKPIEGCGGFDVPALLASDAYEFLLEMPESGQVRLETTGPLGRCNGNNTVLEVYDTDGVTVVATDDNGGEDVCSRIDTTLAAGPHRVLMRGVAPYPVIGRSELRFSGPGLCGACGNALPDTGEDCDDGDPFFDKGDACSETCTYVPCGRPMSGTDVEPSILDALYVLQASVSARPCAVRVCDVDGTFTVTSTDALTVLRAALGLGVLDRCLVGD